MSNAYTSEGAPVPSPIPPSSPPLDDQLDSPASTGRAWDGLAAEAARVAGSWKLSPRRTRCRTLESATSQVEQTITTAAV